jgi:competence protein ComEC
MRYAILIAALAGLTASAQVPRAKTLDIYVIDVEGGNATLFVGPTGESLLMDTGNAGAAAVRDAGRILDAMKDAGLTRIDHLITTHWHEFIDHGPNVQPGELADNFLKNVYPKLHSAAKHRVARPGDKIPLGAANVLVVTSAGETIKTSLPGAGKANPTCSNFKPADNNAEDPQSVGIHVTFGKFRTIHLGDLTRNKEFELMCPTNKIGTVDALLGLHHGQPSSNSIVLVHALRPRVAIMNDGTRKGGDPDTMTTVHSSPGLEDLWQLHFSLLSGQEYTPPGLFIANTVDDPIAAMPIAPQSLPQPGTNAPPAPVHNGKAYWIKLSAQADGVYTVTNSRNGFAKTYRPGD